MNKREAMEYNQMMDNLRSLGFERDECEQLRRISMTLHRWHERECGDGNGCIERDEKSGFTFWNDGDRSWRIPDRETGARKRLAQIIARRNDRRLMSGEAIDVKNPPLLQYFIQTDPRGAALYILRPGDVPEGASADSCYSRGICVY